MAGCVGHPQGCAVPETVRQPAQSAAPIGVGQQVSYLVSQESFMTSNTPSIFNFHNHEIRVIKVNGEPWFVASDVAEALGYRDATNAARNLGEHQKSDTQIASTSSNGSTQMRSVTIISESGLYRLVLRSRKPEAEAFSDWVTGEVLPSIRKTGSYQVGQQQELAIDETAESIRRDSIGSIIERLTSRVQQSNTYPVEVFMPLVNAVLRKAGLDFVHRSGHSVLPISFAQELEDRLASLGRVFHPMTSPHFHDVIAIRRILSGMDPKTGMKDERCTPMLTAPSPRLEPELRRSRSKSFPVSAPL